MVRGQDAAGGEPGVSSAVRSSAGIPPHQLGLLHARLANAAIEPVRVAFCGSSTTAGENATDPRLRYVNRFVAALQLAYPAVGGVESAVIASPSAVWGELSPAPGVHAYNAGEGGTQSADYLTPLERANVAALEPVMVLHMVLANDYGRGVPVALAKEQLVTVIRDLRSQITGPCLHVLVNSYPRFDDAADAAHVAPWSEYGQAMREVADLFDDVVYVDIAPQYDLVDVPGADPLGLIDTDKVHQTDRGHEFMAELLCAAFEIAPAAAAHGDGADPLSRPEARASRRTQRSHSQRA